MKRSITMKTQKALGIAALMLPVLLVMAPPAKANDYSFDFVANDASYSVSGIISAADVTNGISNPNNGSSVGQDILSISGLVTGAGGGTILSLVNNPNQPNPFNNGSFQYDNVVFPTAEPFLDTNGVLFTAGAGDTWNLWGNGNGGPGNYELFSYTANGGVDVHGNMTMAAIPEPEIYAMMGIGLALMGFVARRRKGQAVAA
jgi:hypothetical protein